MDALDGNAIAGALMEHFGHEMTMAKVRCSHCQSTMMMAELRVYTKAPGAVARCPACDQVTMVIVNARGDQRLDMPNMEMISPV
jgi:Zn finger protein HypA/HybF involved in hydrogenase expression